MAEFISRAIDYEFYVGFNNGTVLVFQKTLVLDESPQIIARKVIKTGYLDRDDNMLFSPNVIASVWWKEKDD